VASGPERGALAAQSKVVARKIEQDRGRNRLHRKCQRSDPALHGVAARGARRRPTESDPVRQKAFEDRAALCRAVDEEALEKKQEVKPIPPGTLDQILKELNTAAQQAKKTVDPSTTRSRSPTRCWTC